MDHILKLLLLCVCPISVMAAPFYTVRSVGPPGAAYTGKVAISNNGAVAATAINDQGASVAMWFDASGGSVREQTDALAAGLNSSGTAAGTAFGANGPHATVWQNGGARILDIDNSMGLAINNGGTLAGSGQHGSRMSAFVNSNGKTTWIDAGGWSAAYGINGRGEVAGTAEVTPGRFEAFTWSKKDGVEMLGTLGGRSSYAAAISDPGVVVGSSMTSKGALHAFRYDGEMVDLGTLGGNMSAAYGINSSGMIVGYSTIASGISHAFVWRDGTLFDLNSLIDGRLGWTLGSAYGINERRDIAGIGTLNGVSSIFVLSRSEDTAQRSSASFAQPAAAVPEPSSWMLAGAGIAFLAGATWVRRSG